MIGRVGLMVLAAALCSCRGAGCSKSQRSEQEQPGEVHVSMEVRGDVGSLPASYAPLYRALQWVQVPSWNQKIFRGAAVVSNAAKGTQELFLVRIGRAGEGQSEEPQSIEFAVVDGGGETAPQWRPAGRLLGPAWPAIAVGPDGAARCVLTGIQPGGNLQGRSPFDAPRRVFAFDPRAAKPALFDPGFGEAIRGPLASLDEKQRLWILGQPWHAPIEDHLYWPLRISATATAAQPAFSNDVANTDKPLAVHGDYAVFAGSTEIHLVFEAEVRAEGQKPETHHFHDVLDADGRTLKRTDLGVAELGRMIVALFAGPEGKLYMLSIVHSQGRVVSHEIKDIGASVQRRGGREQYFVDRYLGLHVVWFEGEQPKYAGPTRLHGYGVFQ